MHAHVAQYKQGAAMSGGGGYKPPDPFLPRGGLGVNELDLLTSAVYSDLRGAGGVGSAPLRAVAAAAAGSEQTTTDDMISVMCRRLQQAESSAAQLRTAAAQKEKQLLQLQQQAISKDEELEVLKIQNSKLALQVVEMTQYLKEQGLQWVGSGRVSPLVSSALPSPPTTQEGGERRLSLLNSAVFPEENFDLSTTTQTEPQSPPQQEGESSPLYFSLESLKERVAELNLIAGEKVIKEEQRLADGRAIARLVDPDSIEVVLYSDGICVERGVFRPYSWALCRAFLDDILDGYFPYEYQNKYPRGMVIKLVDKSDQPHPTAKEMSNMRGLEDGEGYRVLSRQSFLNRLPKQVITATGQVVHVRQGVSEFISGPAAKEHKTTEVQDGKGVELKVRIVGGGNIIVRIAPTQTVGRLQELVSAHLPEEHAGKQFEMLTVYPRVVYDDSKLTLKEANLSFNSALLLRFL